MELEMKLKVFIILFLDFQGIGVVYKKKRDKGKPRNRQPSTKMTHPPLQP